MVKDVIGVTMVTISSYIKILDHYIIHLKLIQYCMVLLIKLEVIKEQIYVWKQDYFYFPLRFKILLFLCNRFETIFSMENTLQSHIKLSYSKGAHLWK